MSAYYNEIEPFAAQWLRNLIAAGHIAPGDVDERSIEDVRPDDLRGYAQCHFFAGVGVWSYALRLAGWPDDRPVWTGSCPCQPFSAAGKGAGFADERHLWPHFHWLIQECRPPVIFGEQVEAAIKHGWLDLVLDDLEGSGYAFGATGIPAAGVGAPHPRHRLYFVADSSSQGLQERIGDGRIQQETLGASPRQTAVGSCRLSRLADLHGDGRSQGREGRAPLGHRPTAQPDCGSGRVEYTSSLGWNGRKAPASGHIDDGATPRRAQDKHGVALSGAPGLHQHGAGPINGFWRDADWLFCRDGKWRPVEPGTFPLAHGAPARVGRLRAYGNAINAQTARVFIETVMAGTP